MSADAPATGMDALAADLGPSLRALDKARYARHLGQAGANRAYASALETRHRAIMDGPTRAQIEALPFTNAPPELLRRAELWRHLLELERCRHGGQALALTQRLCETDEQRERAELILAQEPDRERRRDTWLILSVLGTRRREDLLAVRELRNDAARRAGYDDFGALLLATSRRDRNRVLGDFDLLVEATQSDYARFLSRARDLLAIGELRPWDLAYAEHRLLALGRSSESPGRTAQCCIDLLVALGFDGSRAPSFHFEASAGRTTGAFALDPPFDVRVVFDRQPRPSDEVDMLFALGCGLHWRHVRREAAPEAHLLWESSTLRHAVGAYLAGIVRHACWGDFLGLDASEADSLAETRQQVAASRLRRQMAQAALDLTLYEAVPESRRDGVSGAILTRYLEVEHGEHSAWAASDPLEPSHLAVYAERAGRLIGEALKRELGPPQLPQHAVSDWLIERIMSDGALLDDANFELALLPTQGVQFV